MADADRSRGTTMSRTFLQIFGEGGDIVVSHLTPTFGVQAKARTVQPLRLKEVAGRFKIRELAPDTWPDFVRIMEKHNGVWNGCWCVTFHKRPGQTIPSRRALKEELVHRSSAHAALVYDGLDIVGWCQFGSPTELPGRLGGFMKLDASLPDWRITCFFVDRDRRGEGIGDEALSGAIAMIAASGGGVVDAYPVATGSGSYPSSFLWGGTESMFAKCGFSRLGALGKSKLVMRAAIGPLG